MFCLSNFSTIITTTSTTLTVAQANLPESDPPSPNNDIKPSSLVSSKSTFKSLATKKRKASPTRPTVVQIERIVGAGSFRDGQPPDLDVRKSVFDLFLGKAFEGPVEKKMRETGEWLINNTEKDFRSSGKRILFFVLQWILPIWAISLLIATGAIKLPFSSPFLDDLIM